MKQLFYEHISEYQEKKSENGFKQTIFPISHNVKLKLYHK